MRTGLPNNEGDGIIRPGLSESPLAPRRQPAVSEVEAIISAARKMRSEVAARLFKRFARWLSGAPARANQRAIERFFHPDLERRLRQLERDRPTALA